MLIHPIWKGFSKQWIITEVHGVRDVRGGDPDVVDGGLYENT